MCNRLGRIFTCLSLVVLFYLPLLETAQAEDNGKAWAKSMGLKDLELQCLIIASNKNQVPVPVILSIYQMDPGKAGQEEKDNSGISKFIDRMMIIFISM